MPEKSEVLFVRIKKDPNDPLRCIVEHSFVAKRRSFVEFEFLEEPDALLTFAKGSPFGPTFFKPRKMQVSQGALAGPFEFLVSWLDKNKKGEGKGTGEVIDG